MIVDGVLGSKAVLYLHHLAEKLSADWKRSYGEVLGWIKAWLSFAIVRATNLCLRRYNVCWRSGTGVDDGAELLVVMPLSH